MNDVSKTIRWAEKSWNAITGCANGCPYCYARRMYKRFKKSFKPTFHPKRLQEVYKLKKPSRIFASSVTDFWSTGVDPDWRKQVFQAMNDNPRHQYFILTKRPENILENERRAIYKFFIGVSVTQNGEWWDRYTTLAQKTLGKRFISFEPLLEEISVKMDWANPDWVIIGGLTGCKQKTNHQWVDKLLRQIPDNIPVFIKDNLNYKPKQQEFPNA